MIKVETWVLSLINEITSEPKYYYNRTENTFQANFNNQCAFLDEKSCLNELAKLGVEGVEVVKGTMDYPKELLINIMLETFSENGLI